MIKSQSKRTSCVKLSASIAAVGVLLSAGVASAATASENLDVGASVVAHCTIVAGSVTFGVYDPIVGLELEVDGTVTVTCTNGSAVAVTLGQGQNAGGGSSDAAPDRHMLGPAGALLSYSLFSDPERTAVWGNTTDTDVARTGTGVADPLTVYGRLPAGQTDAVVGTYSDVVVATVTF